MRNLDFISDETMIFKEELFSPSGKYRLVITRHLTKSDCCNYSRGRVYEYDRLIADVHRNYYSFPFAWVEEHPNTGYDYLLCGEDYQGYTVIELNTGERRDHQDKQGWCWAEINAEEKNIFTTLGCIWGGSFEFRVYDFTHPLEQPYPILRSWLENPEDDIEG
jgi:hypothetical protein